MNSSGVVKNSLVFSLLFIAIIVVSAIAFIDPLERVAQQKDKQLENYANQILGAISSYQEQTAKLPWAVSAGSKTSFTPLSWKMANDFAVGICGDEACTLPGEALSFAGAGQSLTKKKAAFNIWREIYISRGVLPQDKVNTCFVPFSRAERKKVAELFRINLEQSPVPSKLNSCDQNVTWFENDVCWKCVSE